MTITREQADAAITALGLDPTDVRTVTITSTGVHVDQVRRDDAGIPVIDHGQALYEQIQHDITEAIDDDA